MDKFLRGLKVFVAEEPAQPGSFHVMYMAGVRIVNPHYAIDDAIRNAVAYDEQGLPAVLLSRLPRGIAENFPPKIFRFNGEEIEAVPVRAGGLS